MCLRKEAHTLDLFLMNWVQLKRRFRQFGGNVVTKVSRGPLLGLLCLLRRSCSCSFHCFASSPSFWSSSLIFNSVFCSFLFPFPFFIMSNQGMVLQQLGSPGKLISICIS